MQRCHFVKSKIWPLLMIMNEADCLCNLWKKLKNNHFRGCWSAFVGRGCSFMFCLLDDVMVKGNHLHVKQTNIKSRKRRCFRDSFLVFLLSAQILPSMHTSNLDNFASDATNKRVQISNNTKTKKAAFLGL